MNRNAAPLVALLALVLVACTAGPASRSATSPAADHADVIVVTIIEEEYQAMLRWLDEPRELPDPSDRQAVGVLRGTGSERPPRVALIGAEEEGEVSGALSTRAALERWHAPVVLLVGIAGGIETTVTLGDVVVATEIWNYDIGHLGEAFEPGKVRFEPDPGLLQAARRVPAGWSRDIRAVPPKPDVTPRVLEAEVASGDKVIETSGSAFFAAIQNADTRFAAIEMEGAGAATAIERARADGASPRFLMIRGISDLVQPDPSAPDVGDAVARNPQRAAWRKYAADAAATFAAEVIRQHWHDATR